MAFQVEELSIQLIEALVPLMPRIRQRDRSLEDQLRRAKLTQGALNSLPIALPPLTELVEIVARVKRALEADARVSPFLHVLRELDERLSSALLAKAFRGELVPQDPNDEPAEDMLAGLTGGANGGGSATPATKRSGRSAGGARAQEA